MCLRFRLPNKIFRVFYKFLRLHFLLPDRSMSNEHNIVYFICNFLVPFTFKRIGKYHNYAKYSPLNITPSQQLLIVSDLLNLHFYLHKCSKRICCHPCKLYRQLNFKQDEPHYVSWYLDTFAFNSINSWNAVWNCNKYLE